MIVSTIVMGIAAATTTASTSTATLSTLATVAKVICTGVAVKNICDKDKS